MTLKPTRPEDLLNMPAPIEPSQDPMADESWDTWEGESPEFTDDEMFDALNRSVASRPVTRRDPPQAAAPGQPPSDSLAGQLERTPEPAIGMIGVDLALHGAALSAALRAFSGSGPTLVNVAREPNGRFVATIQKPGGRYVAPEAFTPPLGDARAAQASAARWLRDVVAGVAQAAIPTITIISQGCDLPEDALESIAREAACIVAVLEHRDGVARPGWEPRLLKPIEPAPVPAAIAQPSKPLRRNAAVSANPRLMWMATVPELVEARGHPEAIEGPAGERVSVSYGHRDDAGRPYVLLSAATESPDGRLRKMELEIAPGVVVDLVDVRVLVR